MGIWRSYAPKDPGPRLCFIVRSHAGGPYARTNQWADVPTIRDEIQDITGAVPEVKHDAMICDMPQHAALRA